MMAKKKLKCWKKHKLFDGIKWTHRTKKMPSGMPDSIRIVTTGVDTGSVILGNRKTRKFKDEFKAESFAKTYMKKHNVC